jgi:lysophospholipase L1-like esterase
MRRISAGAAILLALATALPVQAAGGSSQDNAKRYYVSVGDSLAAGVQPIGDPANGDRTDEGYAEQLLAIAKGSLPKLSLVKLGCPGETTTTLIHGGLCSYNHGSQLDEAVSFLRGHRSLTAFVTIDVGANDFACYEPACVGAGVASIQANLPVILAALRDAAGPDVPIVGMTMYNPLLGAWLTGPDGQAYAFATQQQFVGPVNQLVAGIFLASGARVADVAAAFSSDDFATQVPLPGVGLVPLNVARICMWTWVCAPSPLGPNNHANAAGYAVIAQAFAAALGF